MASIEILKHGLLSSIQDLGRKGLAFYAIPSGGVMDVHASVCANRLVNNPDWAPTIECTVLAPEIRFDFDTTAAICGSDMQWRLNNASIPLDTPIKITAGDVLSGKYCKNGMRSFIAIRGIPRTQQSYNSYSTYPLAGLGANAGKYLAKGDKIEWQKNELTDHHSHTLELGAKSEMSPSRVISICRGPEYDCLNSSSQAMIAESQFTISPDSNRMGARLTGPPLDGNYKLTHSKSMLPGFLQLLPSGQLVVILQDGQTTGGYPRIAYIREPVLRQFNQIPFNHKFRFRWVN